ncbi:hypothetical protein OESDEN_14889 [Oesophagostomum dentatum]|uniref:Uncharacterized protein n=1 Tax=Oesophagostomum dentatum TaxID=61180 RepID=A0A0B1SPC7_OESDE|nr:hypothetical protein OESDEN_14889 [Oesophagostomum dentatum]
MPGKLIDNEPRSLGVVTNIDYLVNEPRVFMYKDVKAVDLEDKKPEGEKEPLPILDHSTNLKHLATIHEISEGLLIADEN